MGTLEEGRRREMKRFSRLPREMAAAEIRPDFKDWLRMVNQHQVTCLIAGGYAVMK
jgi:hypothetical protein